MRQQQSFDALGIEVNLYLIVFCHFITIDAHYRTITKHTMSNTIVRFKSG